MSATIDPDRSGGHDDGPDETAGATDEAPDSSPMRALVRRAVASDRAGQGSALGPAGGVSAPGGEGGGADEPHEPAGGTERLVEVVREVASVPIPAPQADLLRGVQRRLRVRSQGKFYADGWSTRDEHPRGAYLVTAVVMLVLLAAVYLALVPGGIGRP
jgi:hypothetical protein